MQIFKSPLQLDDEPIKRPLMIGSSGGGGHNSAIQGLQSYLINNYADRVEFTTHAPTLHASVSKKIAKNLTKNRIDTGLRFMHHPAIGGVVKRLIKPFVPILPDKKSLDEEVISLVHKEMQHTQGRFYVDLLLDSFPAGYESVAIWNVLQRQDEVAELKKLIEWQTEADKQNYHYTYQFFFDKLIKALNEGKPYTEIISSQAMALSALCDAIIAYNRHLEINPNLHAPKLIIHEYVIELATNGAVYYFSGLSRLTPQQQQQMNLYAVNMNRKFISNFSKKGNFFNGLYAIPKQDNPLIRPAFTNPKYDNSHAFKKECTLSLGENGQHTIAAKEKIASIMLGSQAGNDTVDYIESLLKAGIDKLFVFGGKNPNISAGINAILQKNPAYASKIIGLGNQGDEGISSLMTRSNILVIRAGALSTQEQLAMSHNPLQSVFIHHANSPKDELTSGLAWEDANADELVVALRRQNVHADKICPNRAYRQFAQARLIAFIKEIPIRRRAKYWDSDYIAQHVRMIPDIQLHTLLSQLDKPNTVGLHHKINEYFKSCEKSALSKIKQLSSLCSQAKQSLVSCIKEELKLQDSNFIMKELRKKTDEYPGLKDINSNASQLINSYLAIMRLQKPLNQAEIPPSLKLKHFKALFSSEHIQKSLGSPPDSFFKWIIKKIEALLSNAFPSLAKKATYKEKIQQELAEIPPINHRQHQLN